MQTQIRHRAFINRTLGVFIKRILHVFIKQNKTKNS